MAILLCYEERVYAGVLGKLIGVYLGRPIENEAWTYERIMAELGEIYYYVNEKLNRPLIVTDDDISGTLTFLRALPDYDNSPNLTPTQIGQTWLNYIIESRNILWWGGLSNSTEHTAYLRLRNGIQAPYSGSARLNSKIVSEQIGAQIFIDGWALVAPGDPQLAADLSRSAASVSHDGEAIYGAQVVAAMEAQAFVESDIDKLIDVGISFIPTDSVIYRMITDIREWHAGEPDWHRTRERIAATYGYDRYGGNCHIIPNHALIILSLLYGEGNFQKSLMIANTSGWDTDCNSGNVGCLLGIRNGLAGLEAGPDWRGPVADRLYLPTADGGRAVTDALTEAYHIVNIGRSLAGLDPVLPKDAARFHFELPGAVQGFLPEDSVESKGTISVENVCGYSQKGERSLALRYKGVALGRVARASTATFIPSVETARYFDGQGYALMASPTLYPGQVVKAGLSADNSNKQAVTCCLYLRVYEGPNDEITFRRSHEFVLRPGEYHELDWSIDDTDGAPIAAIGVEVNSEARADGTVYLDYLTWEGAPNTTLTRPFNGGAMWRRAWINGMDQYDERWPLEKWPESFRMAQNHGRGLLIQGMREWTDYKVSAGINLHMVKAAGLAARVQGMRRYYALLLCNDGKARLVKALDGEAILAETNYTWHYAETHTFALRVVGNTIAASLDGQVLFEVEDHNRPLTGGGVAFVCEEGRISSEAVEIRSVL